MATVRDILEDALRVNGALGQGEALADDDWQVALRALRRMLGTLANQPLALYETQEGTLTLTPGTVSYSTSLLSTGRPVSIDSAFLRLSSIDYPLTFIDNQSYNDRQYKNNTGLPTEVYYEPGYPSGTFYFYYAPASPYVAHITGRYPLIAGTITLDTTIALPEGYEAMLVNSLAVKTAALFGRPVTQQMKDDERDALAWLKRTNAVHLELKSDLPFRRATYNGLMGPI